MSNKHQHQNAQSFQPKADHNSAEVKDTDLAQAEKTKAIEAVFGAGSAAAVLKTARANTFVQTERYQNFLKFYHQNPNALKGVVHKMFEAWLASPFGIEVDLLQQQDQYVIDANKFPARRHEDLAEPYLVHVAYTLFVRAEDLSRFILPGDLDTRSIVELAHDVLMEESTELFDNIEFARFWGEVAY